MNTNSCAKTAARNIILFHCRCADGLTLTANNNEWCALSFYNWPVVIQSVWALLSMVYTTALCRCLSQVGILLKWLNVGWCKKHCTIAQGNWFSGAKELGETGLPPTEMPNACGVGWSRQILTNNLLYLENGTRLTYSYYWRWTGSPMHSNKWWHCAWPCLTPNDLKPTQFLHFISL